MKTYEIITVVNQEVVKCINEDGTTSFIPIDRANSDYQAYLDRDKPKAALSTPIVDETSSK